MTEKDKSEEIEQEIPEAEVSAEQDTEETAEEAPAALEDDLKKAQAELKDLNDRFLRMAAEYDNFRKRSAKERENLHGDAVAFAVSKLLPVYDNLERAIAQDTADTEYKKGVEMILKQFNDSLSALSVAEIEAGAGTAFDPSIHNAVMHIEDETLGENQIAEVFQKGFKIGERVVRHAIVKVAN